MPNLPQELIDSIIDNMQDDTPGLKSISLAFRAAVSSAQSHLFHTVVLTSARPSVLDSSEKEVILPCQKLSNLLLSSSAHLTPLIKDLRVLEEGVPWIRSPAVETVSNILALLNPKRILFRALNGRDPGSWAYLPETFKSSLERIFRSPGLESIQIYGFYIPCPRQFPSFPGTTFRDAPASLKTLAVCYRERSGEYISIPLWLPQLQSLSVRYSGSHSRQVPAPPHIAHSLAKPTLDFSRLRSLCLWDFVCRHPGSPERDRRAKCPGRSYCLG